MTGRGFAGLAVAIGIVLAAPASAGAAQCFGETVTISGTSGSDVLLGTSGRDVINAKEGVDIIRARGEDDVICSGPGFDRSRGGAGDDVLYDPDHFNESEARGGSGDDDIYGNSLSIGGAGADRLRADFFESPVGVNEVHGGDGPDVIMGSNPQTFGRLEEIYGGDGDDVIKVLHASSTVYAGRGDDVVRSFFTDFVGNYVFFGQSGDDVLVGGNLDDEIYGGSGDDFIDGNGDEADTGGIGDICDGQDGENIVLDCELSPTRG